VGGWLALFVVEEPTSSSQRRGLKTALKAARCGSLEGTSCLLMERPNRYVKDGPRILVEADTSRIRDRSRKAALKHLFPKYGYDIATLKSNFFKKKKKKSNLQLYTIFFPSGISQVIQHQLRIFETQHRFGIMSLGQVYYCLIFHLFSGVYREIIRIRPNTSLQLLIQSD
jgi:hypothetical protein